MTQLKIENTKTKVLVVSIFVLTIVVGLIALVVRRVANPYSRYVIVELIGSGGNWWEFSPRIPNWLSSVISRGDREVTTAGKTIAEILEVKKYDEGSNRILYLKVKLLVTPGNSPGTFRFRQLPLEVGSSITIHPNNVKITGNVIAIEGKHPPGIYRTVLITVKLFDQKSWITEAFHIGDSASDNQGNVIARIIDKSVAPSLTTVNTSDGRIVVRNNPLLRDITFNIKIQAVEREGTLYFNQVQPIKVANFLWIPLGNININEAQITSFDIADE